MQFKKKYKNEEKYSFYFNLNLEIIINLQKYLISIKLI